MNILFLTMNIFTDINMHNIYSDLMQRFILGGHKPYIVTPREKKTGEKTQCLDFGDYCILKVRVGNLSNVSLIEKGISTVTIENCFKRAIDKHLGSVDFDLILYSTPPITFSGVVRKMKKKCNAVTYLMLKDIFPQNAVDIGMFSKNGPIYKYFRSKEKSLYAISDYIGCMSEANVRFLCENNIGLDKDKIEICPNSITVPHVPTKVSKEEKSVVRKKYNIPQDKTVFLYGGNLGKPQGIDFLIDCLKCERENEKAFFVIIGSGSEHGKLEEYLKQSRQGNLIVLNALPKTEYDKLTSCCDVGMIFLDYRFTIPNFPSRVLSYMQAAMPVLCVTDEASDIGDEAEIGHFGFKCPSNSTEEFHKEICKICDLDNIAEYGDNAYSYLCENYNVDVSYNAIVKHIKKER